LRWSPSQLAGPSATEQFIDLIRFSWNIVGQIAKKEICVCKAALNSHSWPPSSTPFDESHQNSGGRRQKCCLISDN